MAGPLVGAVMDAADELAADGLTRNGFSALLTIAEGCRDGTREGRVARRRIASVARCSERSASRAIAELVERGLIAIVERGHRLRRDDGVRGVTTLYRLQLGDTQVSRDSIQLGAIQVAHDFQGPTELGATQVSRDSIQLGATGRQLGDTSDQLGDTVGGTVPVDLPVEVPGRAREPAPAPAREGPDDFAVAAVRRLVGCDDAAARSAAAQLVADARRPPKDPARFVAWMARKRPDEVRDAVGRTTALDAACRYCEAAPGRPCVDPGAPGRPEVTIVHRDRLRAAVPAMATA